MQNKPIYSECNVAPLVAIYATKWRCLLSMRPVMVNALLLAKPCPLQLATLLRYVTVVSVKLTPDKVSHIFHGRKIRRRCCPGKQEVFVHTVQISPCDVWSGIVQVEQLMKDSLHQLTNNSKENLVDALLYCHTIGNVRKNYPLSEKDASTNHYDRYNCSMTLDDIGYEVMPSWQLPHSSTTDFRS